jgi:4-hydroxyphenylpyruvate dioxygenase-like putative hemolysin
MSGSYIVVGNKQQLLNAIKALPYTQGEISTVINERANGGRTTFTFNHKGCGVSEMQFKKRKSKTLAMIRRTDAHVWK